LGLTPRAAENYKGSRAPKSIPGRAIFRRGTNFKMLAVATKPEPALTAPRAAWRDVELLLLIVLVLGVYFIRLTAGRALPRR
jgi:hypothetical protein